AVFCVGVVGGQRGGRRTQHVHGVGVLDDAYDVDDAARQSSLAPQTVVERRQLLTRGQRAVQQQVGGLFEARLLCQVVDRVAAVEQDALFAIDEARLGSVEDDVAKTFSQRFGH